MMKFFYPTVLKRTLILKQEIVEDADKPAPLDNKIRTIS